MPKKKTLTDNALVQKSNKLMPTLSKQEPEIFDNATMSNWFRKKMNIFEYRILDLYMASINSHDISTKEVVIDLKNVMELTNARLTLDEYRKLMFNVMSSCVVSNNEGDDKFINLFQYAELKKNENGEPSQIILMCTPKAEEYFFNLDSVGYFKYKFKTIQNIGSVYSYLLFNYLEQNRFRKKWEISVDNLKQILDCNEEIYDVFKRFNDLVLKKSITELNDNHRKVNDISDADYCEYSYQTVKHGRKVIAIEFTVNDFDFSVKPIAALTEPIPDDKQMSLFDEKISELADFFITQFGDEIVEELYRDFCIDQMKLLKVDADEDQINIILKRSIDRFNVVLTKTKVSDGDKYFRKIIETECVNVAKKILQVQQDLKKAEPEQEEQSYDLSKVLSVSEIMEIQKRNKNKDSH